MPNGRSGGFAIKRIDLEQLLLSVPPATVIGMRFGRSGTVTAAEASHALKDDRGESLGVEEQDQLDYIIHVGGTDTWIVVTPVTPLYTELRHHHKQWLLQQGPPSFPIPVIRGVPAALGVAPEMSPSVELQCRILASREPDSSLWSFYLINDGGTAIELAELEEVKYEWGDQYVGGESPGLTVADLAPGGRALIWRDDGSSVTSELRTDLWLRVKHRGLETWLLFEFPKLYRQRGTTLIAHPTRMGGPP